MHVGRACNSSRGSSCAGMVAGVLGVPLNKSQQCSTWHLRPLSPEQMLYAANDAAVLLALFDALAAVAPPERFRVVRLPHGAHSLSHHGPPDAPPARRSVGEGGTPQPATAGALDDLQLQACACACARPAVGRTCVLA